MLVHMGVTRHETCDEHGELIEPASFAPTDRTEPTDATEPTEPAEPADLHEHCPIAVTPSQATAPVAFAAPSVVTAPLPLIVRPRSIHVAHDVLRSAPKTSPPAFAT